MPRTVTQTIDDRVDAQGTQPLLLVQLSIHATPFYLSSMEEATTGGQTWSTGALKVSSIVPKSGGTLEATVEVAREVSNGTVTVWEACLATRPHRQDADIYTCYWDGAAYTDPQLILEGTVTSVEARPKTVGGTGVSMVEFRIASKTATKGGSVPFVRLSPPFIKALSVKGSRFSWGSQIVELS